MPGVAIVMVNVEVSMRTSWTSSSLIIYDHFLVETLVKPKTNKQTNKQKTLKTKLKFYLLFSNLCKISALNGFVGV